MRVAKFVAVAVAGLSALAAPSADAKDKLLVVAHRADNQVGIYKAEGTNLTLLKALPVGQTPRELCISPDGTRAYVSAQAGNNVTVVDLDALSVVGSIEDEALKGADGCIVSPDNRKLYVVSTGRDSLVIADTASRKVTKEVKLPLGVPRRVVFNPANTKLYIGSNKTPEIAIVDVAKETVESTFPVGNEARGGLAFTPDGKTFLVGNVEDDTLSIVDTATHKVAATKGTPLSPQRIVVSKDGHFAYVLTRMGSKGADEKHNPVLYRHAINDKHELNITAPVAQAPWGLAVSDDEAYLYVSSNQENVINVIDRNTFKVLNTVKVNKDPNGIAFRP
jgi:YVTN family beta-propeller protein